MQQINTLEEFNKILKGWNEGDEETWEFLQTLKKSKKWDQTQREIVRNAVTDGCGGAIVRFLMNDPIALKNFLRCTRAKSIDDEKFMLPAISIRKYYKLALKDPEAAAAGKFMFAGSRYKVLNQQEVTYEHETSRMLQMYPCSKCGVTESELQKVTKLCSRCKKARYCSVECQKEDWQEHKKVCQSNAAT